jgi:hypothetical protein
MDKNFDNLGVDDLLVKAMNAEVKARNFTRRIFMQRSTYGRKRSNK